MSEKRTEERQPGGAEPETPLAALARQLREEAAAVPAHRRAEAVSAAESVHAHATSGAPDVQKMTPHLRRLETFAELAPTVNAILQALSNVGM
jgi:glyceraldehyde-3-phosphate dehydrogenase/erythrose-4-phosphate dehydrogenase